MFSMIFCISLVIKRKTVMLEENDIVNKLKFWLKLAKKFLGDRKNGNLDFGPGASEARTTTVLTHLLRRAFK